MKIYSNILEFIFKNVMATLMIDDNLWDSKCKPVYFYYFDLTITDFNICKYHLSSIVHNSWEVPDKASDLECMVDIYFSVW